MNESMRLRKGLKEGYEGVFTSRNQIYTLGKKSTLPPGGFPLGRYSFLFSPHGLYTEIDIEGVREGRERRRAYVPCLENTNS